MSKLVVRVLAALVTLILIGCSFQADPHDQRPLMLFRRDVIAAGTKAHQALHQQCLAGDKTACQRNCTNQSWPDGTACRILCQSGDQAAGIDYTGMCSQAYPCEP